MRVEDLREEITIEFQNLNKIIDELLKLRNEWSEETPTIRDVTASGAFLAQFYTGIE